jgi:hypothetical protein
MKQHVLIIELDDGTETEIPSKFEVCWRCEGQGSHVNPAIDGNGISPEEFAEDPDFAEAYLAGHYDVRCETCHGERVTLEPDYDQMSPDLAEQVEEYYALQAELRRDREHQQRYGY